MLAMLRNFSTDDLATGTLVGADEEKSHSSAVTGLNKGQGQAVFADGSARQINNQVIKDTVRNHKNSSGGFAKGAASTKIIGCCGESGHPKSWWIDCCPYYYPPGSNGYFLEKDGVFSLVKTNRFMSWLQAKDDAQRRGGHLATITSQSEWLKLLKLRPKPGYFWLGGYKPKITTDPSVGWKWVTGEAWGYTAWFGGDNRFAAEPNNLGGNEKYLCMEIQ
jgi:hypothetical protein